MRNFGKRLVEWLCEKNIKNQMLAIYLLAILLPMVVIGGVLTVYLYLYSDKNPRILLICILIVVTGALISYIVITFFASHFSSRVNELRSSMHDVSNEDYDVPDSLRGNDEISMAYEELKKMAQLIKEKDAEMYETKIDAERFATEQQMMEYKMLSSQINPHFLYNTLEALRMRAISEKDRDVATGIKLLGKSMRYILDNTGTVSVPLQQELDYIENYIKRLEKLEEVASSFEGVERSFAIQAGREVRIIVKPEAVKDEQMILLARDICKKIEEEIEYPGQIKVNIIRESRAVEYAR